MSKENTPKKRKEKSQEKKLKGLSHEIDLKNFDQNLQNLAKLRAAAGF